MTDCGGFVRTMTLQISPRLWLRVISWGQTGLRGALGTGQRATSGRVATARLQQGMPICCTMRLPPRRRRSMLRTQQLLNDRCYSTRRRSSRWVLRV
jgi:hypothetical protein